MTRFATHVEEFDAEDLSDDELERRLQLERRALPRAERPSLPPAIELSLAEVEQLTAEAYCDAEETCYLLSQVAREETDDDE